MMTSVERSIQQGHEAFSELFRGRQRAFNLFIVSHVASKP